MSKGQKIGPECMWRSSRMTRDGTAVPVSRNQFLRREYLVLVYLPSDKVRIDEEGHAHTAIEYKTLQ